LGGCCVIGRKWCIRETFRASMKSIPGCWVTDWANCLVITVEEPVELSYFVSVGKNLALALCSSTSLAGVLLSRLPHVLSERRCLIIEGGAALRGARIPHRSALLLLDGTVLCLPIMPSEHSADGDRRAK
jgi:hypothetical protein